MIHHRIVALLALAALTAFFGVVILKLPRVDLTVAALIGIGLAAYDLWLQLGPGRRPHR